MLPVLSAAGRHYRYLLFLSISMEWLKVSLEVVRCQQARRALGVRQGAGAWAAEISRRAGVGRRLVRPVRVRHVADFWSMR